MCLITLGQVSHYLGYNALLDFFPTMTLKPNESCDDSKCQMRQLEYAKKPKPVVEVIEEIETALHEENEWGKN